jgi:hypothetical protein
MAAVERSGIDCRRSVKLRAVTHYTAGRTQCNNVNVPIGNGDLTMNTIDTSLPPSMLTARCRRSEAGMFILVFAMCVAMLLAFLGLAFDASYMYFYKRRMQTAADAGAIAAAHELNRGSDDATVAARKDTGLNRFTHQSNEIDVAVNNPPLSGPSAGNASFVEVIITQPRPTWFLKILGADSATIRARAVAGLVGSDGCVYALNRDSSNVNNGFFVNGTTNSTFGCGVFSNANFRAVGGGCVVTPGVVDPTNWTGG